MQMKLTGWGGAHGHQTAHDLISGKGRVFSYVTCDTPEASWSLGINSWLVAGDWLEPLHGLLLKPWSRIFD